MRKGGWILIRRKHECTNDFSSCAECGDTPVRKTTRTTGMACMVPRAAVCEPQHHTPVDSSETFRGTRNKFGLMQTLLTWGKGLLVAPFHSSQRLVLLSQHDQMKSMVVVTNHSNSRPPTAY
jgi:hypothetical protein